MILYAFPTLKAVFNAFEVLVDVLTCPHAHMWANVVILGLGVHS